MVYELQIYFNSLLLDIISQLIANRFYKMIPSTFNGFFFYLLCSNCDRCMCFTQHQHIMQQWNVWSGKWSTGLQVCIYQYIFKIMISIFCKHFIIFWCFVVEISKLNCFSLFSRCPVGYNGEFCDARGMLKTRPQIKKHIFK